MQKVLTRSLSHTLDPAIIDSVHYNGFNFFLFWFGISSSPRFKCISFYDGYSSIKNWNVDSLLDAIMRDCVRFRVAFVRVCVCVCFSRILIMCVILAEMCWHTNLLLGNDINSIQDHHNRLQNGKQVLCCAWYCLIKKLLKFGKCHFTLNLCVHMLSRHCLYMHYAQCKCSTVMCQFLLQ